MNALSANRYEISPRPGVGGRHRAPQIERPDVVDDLLLEFLEGV